jgi:hypothetical protein
MWKCSSAVLELDLWVNKCFAVLWQPLNSHHWCTAASYTSQPHPQYKIIPHKTIVFTFIFYLPQSIWKLYIGKFVYYHYLAIHIATSHAVSCQRLYSGKRDQSANIPYRVTWDVTFSQTTNQRRVNKTIQALTCMVVLSKSGEGNHLSQ